MALQSRFPYDLFISYRRVTNQSPDRWVDEFERALNVKLEELIGGAPKISRDTETAFGGEPWKQKTAARIDAAAMFVAVVVGSYFKSEECRYELDYFLGRLKEAKGDESRRIFPVLKQPPDKNSNMPAEWSTFHQTMFYEQAAGSDYFTEIGPSGEPKSQGLFWERLSRLVQDLKRAIDDMAAQTALQRLAMGRIFLAYGGPELKDERDKLRADLQLLGYQVLPEAEYFWNTDGHSALIANHLESSLLAIHLVPRMASSEPATAARVRAQLQLALSTMKAQGKPPPMVWLVPGQQHPSMLDLVNHVQVHIADLGVPIWEGGLDEFKNQVYAKLPRRPVAVDDLPLSAGWPNGSTSPAKVRNLALLVESDEQLSLMALKDQLTGGFNCNPLVVKLSQGMPASERSLATMLARSESVIVFWGRQDEGWLQELLLMPALEAFSASQRLGVYLGQPASEDKAGFRSLLARVLRGDDQAAGGDVGESLASFLQRAGGSAS